MVERLWNRDGDPGWSFDLWDAVWVKVTTHLRISRSHARPGMHHLIQMGCWVIRQANYLDRSKLNNIEGVKDENTSNHLSMSYWVVHDFHPGVRFVDALFGGSAHRGQ